MRRLFGIVLFLMVCVGTGTAVLITEFCPDPYLHDDADEYIVLSGNGVLDGFIISDGRGGFRFPPGATLCGTLTVARSGPAYRESHGIFPDFEWIDYSMEVPDVIPGKPLRLANSGDMLMLYEDGVLVQNISWPGDVRAREGQVHYLEDNVWDPRPLLLGQSRFEPASFSDVRGTAFVSPDSSGGVMMAAVNAATDEILLNIYEFSSPEIAESLIAAKGRNVDVIVLVEGGPVGGISSEEKAVLWQLNQSGIPVYAMAPVTGQHAPYRYDHAKYLIIDRRAILLTSENFKYSGFPPEGMSGNRGWGVYLEDPDLARYFIDVFLFDLHDASVKPYAGTLGNPESPPTHERPGKFMPMQFAGASVRPVIAPDTSREILDLIGSARSSIEIEQAYITNETPLTFNPYLAAAINASRRGVHVRVLLDSYWYNTEDPVDNDEMVALINHVGMVEQIPLEARCADLTTTGLDKIHNKGVIVDDQKVLVSSINWNSNSPNFNREAGIIIDHPGVARYFKDVFDDDWAPAIKSPGYGFDWLKISIVCVVIALLLVLYYRRHVR
ncbi:MAG: phospholipase [Methanomicrobiales archaeon HGW-Methanomicrobiales-3]|jgi:phosphatidylserine/phosphatidylglycerophosphate/cardiolipin synthase-like enzyme|nr:MAG: phospholipase [Methanomicrobiales archaeon HGW-Methanomicrobiales-3]